MRNRRVSGCTVASALAIASGVASVWIASTGGGRWRLGGLVVSMRTP